MRVGFVLAIMEFGQESELARFYFGRTSVQARCVDNKVFYCHRKTGKAGRIVLPSDVVGFVEEMFSLIEVAYG